MDARERGSPPEIREREEEAAHALCRRWGCGSGRDTTDSLLLDVAESFAAFFNIEGGLRSCPFQDVYMGDGWVQELQAARVLVADEKLAWPDALGRDLTAVDVQALTVLKRTESRLDRMRREQDEAERKAREAERERNR